MEVLGGIALKVAVGELYKRVKVLIKDYGEFEPFLEEIAVTLGVLGPLISKIEDLNTELRLPVQKKVTENLRREIENGLKLVNEYSEVGPSLLGCWKKSMRYTDRLRKLDASLRRQLDILDVLVGSETYNLTILMAEDMNVIPKDRHPKHRYSLACDQMQVEDALPPIQMDVPPNVGLAKHVSLIGKVNKIATLSLSLLMPRPSRLPVGAAGDVLTVFYILFDSIEELIMYKRMVIPLLKSIVSTLDSARPVIHQIAQLNEELDLPKEDVENVTQKIDEGIVLLSELSKVQVWNTLKMYRYTDKLLDWEQSIQRQFSILNWQGVRDVVVCLAFMRKTNKVVTLVEFPNINLEEGFEQIATITDLLGKIERSSFRMETKGVKELITSNFSSYEQHLKNTISTLDSFEPMIQKIAKISEEMDFPREEVQNVVEECAELIHKLCKACEWGIFKRNRYMRILIRWEQSLQRQLDILNVQGIRNVKKYLVSMRKTKEVVSRIETSSTSQIEAEVNSCAVGLAVTVKDVLLNDVNCTSDALFAELPKDEVSVPEQIVSRFQMELPNLRTVLPHRVQKAAQLRKKKKRLTCKTHESYGDKQQNGIEESSHLSRAGIHDMYLALQSEKRLALLETKYQKVKESSKLERRKLSEEHNSAMAQVATLTRERDSLLAERTGFLEKNERKIRQEAQEEQRNVWVPQFRRQLQDAEKECFRLGCMAGFKSSMANVERKFPNLDLSDISQFEPIEFDVNVIDELLGSDHYDEADNTEGTTDHSDDNNDDGDNNDFNRVSSTSTHEESIGKAVVKVGDLAKPDVNLPISLKSLYHYAEHDMINGTTIIIDVEEEVFGVTSTIYILQEDVCQLMEMKPLSATCIIVYMRHLYDVLKKSDLVDRVGFCDPSTVSVGVGDSDHKSQVIGTRLLGCINQIVLVPFNCGNHWIFTIISEDRDKCYFMDPLHSLRNLAEWKSIVNNGIKQYNSQTAREIHRQPVWKVLKGPKQPSDVECGYYVMRYMKEVIEDENLSFAKKWDSKKTKFGAYTQTELDKVRCEWASLVSKHCGLLMASS